MSQVEFEESSTQSKVFFNKKESRIVEFIKKYSGGLIKNERQVAYFLLIFACLSVFLFFKTLFFGGPNTNSPTGPIIEEAGSQVDIIF
ncbi:TPA: hypothetical protein DCZ46_00080 [Candidatus Campbellbacteria bacterium]|nr:MAG: protein of unknown function with transmembrane region [Candidatus Campbellbacteria bacterium GW2011_OD1_34_28]KKP74633.1 MAG: hypothetical protein UR74_C0003G0043 [Candidatus Campbellbacteria bacterium GW2011_GWD2_35_24]KKP76765.1 MAG: hypothetical protein UR76_C0003G0043 [Candidatus Campbellbacteria bacterium GW2011_GWC1_35_31]KKP78664.1 MAG: hypothetical protein UR79_C0003G0018 [Candidatus Campbellbacteria bacterium GW2011_GWD1_35_49]HAP74392.1 hypothetical protein [Candidatus Campbel